MIKNLKLLQSQVLGKYKSMYINSKFYFMPFLLSIFAFLVFAFPNNAQANNLQITNVSTTQDIVAKTMAIKFDITWENSWRDSSQTSTNITAANYDAAWVFIKYSKDGGVTWHHAMLKTAGTNPAGYNIGTGPTGIEIVVPNDKVGAFIQRNSGSPTPTGIGQTLTANGVTLLWDYGASVTVPAYFDTGTSAVVSTTIPSLTHAEAATAIIKVMGTEMVYIPTGAFYVGSGLPSSSSADNATAEYKSFFQCTGATLPNTYQIVNENSLCIGGATTGNTVCKDPGQASPNPNLCWTSSTSNAASSSTTPVGQKFPKGYNKFYIMKYEISQDQYKDFLNMLTRTQQDNHGGATTNAASSFYAMSNTSTVSARNSLRYVGASVVNGEPITIVSDLKGTGSTATNNGRWIAQNFLIWPDLVAFAEWTGLRPMTELEFEKAARGTAAPVPGEFAWGQNGPSASSDSYQYITNTTSISGDGTASETDGRTIASMGSIPDSVGIANYNQASAVMGPMRNGYAAAIPTSNASNTRAHSGSSYYGVMELSGNVVEMVVPIQVSSISLQFDGSHGTGELVNSDGYAYQPTLPGRNTSLKIVTSAEAGSRGGSWNKQFTSSDQPLRISSRIEAGSLSGSRTSANDQGGRLVRTAP
jgi:formylglycine-generating enzyme required for sulfatase activity